MALWYTAQAAGRNTPVDVVHSEGTSTVPVNQQINGAQWAMLGTYSRRGRRKRARPRNAGTSGGVVADAVRFHLAGGDGGGQRRDGG